MTKTTETFKLSDLVNPKSSARLPESIYGVVTAVDDDNIRVVFIGGAGIDEIGEVLKKDDGCWFSASDFIQARAVCDHSDACPGFEGGCDDCIGLVEEQEQHHCDNCGQDGTGEWEGLELICRNCGNKMFAITTN